MGLFEKVWEELSPHLPGKRVYFIYTHRNGSSRFANGLCANTEISHFCYKALKSHFPRVTFLRMQNENPRRLSSITSQDVVVGHIGKTFLDASKRTKRVIAFSPWAGHEDRSTNHLFNCMPLQEELSYWDLSKTLILLTSEYNQRHYIEKKSNFWFEHFHKLKNEKNVRIVHQPIDIQLFNRIKWEYGTSDFLYIGNDAHMKGVGDSKRLVAALERKLHLYGVEGRKLNHLDAEEVSKLPLLADFFIQPGMWEGQCVAILEAAARGFIPVVSPETGYPYSHPFLLRFGDFDYNFKTLKKLLHTTAGERKQLADGLHDQLLRDENHNSWKKLTDVLVEEVARLLNS